MSSIGIRNGLSISRCGMRNVAVHRLHQLQDRLRRVVLARALQRLQRRAADHRDVVARELVGLQQLAHLELDQVQQLRVVHHVALVQEHHDRGNAHLARQQDVLARLGHRAVRRRHHQDRPVHLRRARDHVLDVVRVTRAVHVRVVPVRRLVLHVRRVDRDAALPLFGRVVDLVVRPVLHLRVRRGQDLRDRRRQRRLPVVHVPDRPDVHVRLRPVELLLRHLSSTCLSALATRPRSNRSGAHDQIRTGDLVLTKDALCRLSYVGVVRLVADRAPDCSSRRRVVERATGFEPATSSLEGWSSTS